MAQSMKEMAYNMQSQFQKDSKVMNQIEKNQETNLTKTDKENKRITKL